MFLRMRGKKSMKHLLPAFLALSVVACASTGGTPPAQPPAAGDATASAPPPSSSSTPTEANAPAPDAKTDPPTTGPAAAPPQVTGPGTSALGRLPLLITLPDGAVLTPTDVTDQSEVKLASAKGKLTVGAWNPDNDEGATLDAFQKFVTHTKMTMLAKSGSGRSYTVTYKASFSPRITFIRRMKVGDTEVECLLDDARDKSELAAYDAICKSLRAKTP
jgi:hypothetical protein